MWGNQMKNKSNILIVILICLVGYFIFQIYTQNQYLSRFQTSNSQLQKTLEGIISKKKVLEEEKKENTIIISTLTAAKKTNSAEISKLKATQISMENKFMCDKTLIDIDFTDNKRLV